MNISDTALFRETMRLQMAYVEYMPIIGKRYAFKGIREGVLEAYRDVAGISFYDTPKKIEKMRWRLIKDCRTYEDLMYFVTVLGSGLGMEELRKCIRYYLSMESPLERKRRFRNNHRSIQSMSKEKPRFIYRGMVPGSYSDGIFYSLDLFNAALFANKIELKVIEDSYEKSRNGIIKGKIIEREFSWKDILYILPNVEEKQVVLIPDRVKAGNEKIITPKEYKDIALKMDI